MIAVVIGYARVSTELQNIDLQGQLDPARTRELADLMIIAGLPV